LKSFNISSSRSNLTSQYKTMNWLLIFLLVLFSLLSYLLFAPFFLELDSEQNIFRIRFHRLASARLVIHHSKLWLIIRVAGWEKEMDLLKRKSTHAKRLKEKSLVKKRKIPLEKILRVIKTFRLKKFFLAIDSGDPRLNGFAFALAAIIGKSNDDHLVINYRNQNQLILQVENRIIRVLRAVI
jgi:hypothetical protein